MPEFPNHCPCSSADTCVETIKEMVTDHPDVIVPIPPCQFTERVRVMLKGLGDTRQAERAHKGDSGVYGVADR